jgi:hypothetical protein
MITQTQRHVFSIFVCDQSVYLVFFFLIVRQRNVGRGEIVFIGAENSAKSSLSRRAYFCATRRKILKKIARIFLKTMLKKIALDKKKIIFKLVL